ncbi:hypothetical protein O3P69_004225 [Scylla paramamosain]|uniref:Uncharacterized protein n=1 Tax=Scylla paramamosain TaxID=85552 RepID=A0AAW0UHH0_SCYPA
MVIWIMLSEPSQRSQDLVSLLEAEGLEGEEKIVPQNLEGRPIRIALANYPPFLEITETGGRGGVKGRGMSWDVMNALASYFNFTPEPVAAYDNLVGVKGENGWKGALQLIANEEAEFTLMPVTVTEVRKEVVEFSHLLGTTSFGMLVKRPEYTPKPDALLKPFNKEVWFWIIGSMATMGPLIYFIIVFRVRLCRGDPKLTRIMPFDQCCWFVYGAMMKQGSVLKPISDSSRILFATWWLFIMIVTSFYTANLTAFLTFNGLQLPINEVADLEKHSDITWLASRDGAVVDVITSHPQLEILRELKKKGRGRYIDSREEALALVRAGDHVYIDDVQVLEYLIQEDFKRQQREELNQTCNFYTSELERGGELTFWYGFGFKNGSEYTDLFNGFFRRLSIFGILNFLRNSATASSPVCTLPKGFKDRALENKDLYTTYVLYAIGIVASLLALLTESFFRRAMRQTHNLAMATRKTFSDRFNSPPIKVTPSRTGPTQTWNSGLPPLPEHRLRTPFEVKYPQFANLKPQYTPQITDARQVPFARQTGPRVISGKINGVDVKWDQREGKLLLQDVKQLAGNVAYIDGVPYAFLHYRDDDGPKLQKLILSDLI